MRLPILKKMLGADVKADEQVGGSRNAPGITGEQGGRILACFLYSLEDSEARHARSCAARASRHACAEPTHTPAPHQPKRCARCAALRQAGNDVYTDEKPDAEAWLKAQQPRFILYLPQTALHRESTQVSA